MQTPTPSEYKAVHEPWEMKIVELVKFDIISQVHICTMIKNIKTIKRLVFQIIYAVYCHHNYEDLEKNIMNSFNRLI